jgi:hypothetical protein
MSNAYIIPAPGVDPALAASVRASAGLAGGLSFDGYTGGQRVTCATGVNGRLGSSPFTYWIRLMVGARTGVLNYLFAHTLTDAAQGSADNIVALFTATGQLQCSLNGSLGNVTMTTAAGTQANYVGKVIDLCVTRLGTTLTAYVNGAVLVSTTTANAAGAINPDVLKIGASNSSTNVPNDMVVYRTAYFNRALDASEIATLGSSGVQIQDQSASMATISSGSLVIGSRYRITATGGTFTGVGAANNDVGTEFVATGTTPTWGTGTLISIGAILALDYETGIGFQIHDRFQNGMHGALAGSTIPRWTMPKRRGVLYATATFASGVAQRLTPTPVSGLTADAIPSGALIEEVVVNVTTGTPTTVSLGTLSTATTDIVNAQAVASGRNAETMASRFQAAATAQLWATFNAATTATFTIPYTLTQ